MTRQATSPAGSRTPPSNTVRFIVVGLLAFALDLAIFNLLFHQGFSLDLAHITGFLTASVTGYLLNSFWSSKSRIQPAKNHLIHFLIITLLILFLRGGMLASLIQIPNFSPEIAIFICVAVCSLLNYMGSVYSIFPQETGYADPESIGKYFTAGIILYSILLRFFYLGSMELFFEEAYYWNYAQHLDIGYLDHPPMVAWITGLFTKLMGDNEFAVRFGSFACWFVAAWFCYRLTCDIHDRARANQAVLLVAVLPAWFAVGLVMTPDAPLVACWSAALYFLHRALIDDRRLAWAGVGVSFGLGMLSKYTIALLGPAALLFMLVDRHARKWLFRPEPWLAVLLAVALFLPVMVWNAEHQWASFFYQSHDRVAGRFEFSLPYLVLSVILIITPTGLLAVTGILRYRQTVCYPGGVDCGEAVSRTANRRYYLSVVLTLFPVAVFAAVSLFRETKFHWTVPCWLGLAPYIAVVMTRNSLPGGHKWLEWTRRAWPATIVICLLVYGIALHYLSLGFPGIPYSRNLYLLGWQGFGRDIQAIVERVERETGEKILVVGMDRNRIASGLAFYRTRAIPFSASTGQTVRQPAFDTSGWHLFGEKSLMYEYWFPKEEQNGKTMVLVSKGMNSLTGDNVRSRTQQIGDIREILLFKNGKPAGRYYYSLVKNYQVGQSGNNTSPIAPDD